MKAAAKDASLTGRVDVAEPDNERLLDSLRAGQPGACAELVRIYYQRVYRFLVHLTHNVHEAEDLTQETFAAAWEAVAGFEGRATLSTWLHRIAYTKFIDAHRAEQRAQRMRQRYARAELLATDPLDGAMAADEARRLYQALYELDDSERTVLALHYLQGLSYSEMASVLDEPAGTVKWRTSVALHRLRALLQDEVLDHAP
jgi:RNA polymerase sigma-70 factor (ECF subfamily)